MSLVKIACATVRRCVPLLLVQLAVGLFLVCTDQGRAFLGIRNPNSGLFHYIYLAVAIQTIAYARLLSTPVAGRAEALGVWAGSMIAGVSSAFLLPILIESFPPKLDSPEIRASAAVEAIFSWLLLAFVGNWVSP